MFTLCLLAPVALSHEDIAGLVAWVSEQPGSAESLTLGDLDELTTTDDIGEGSAVLRVPESKLLNAKKAANNPNSCLISFAFLEGAGTFPDDYSELATLLLHERRLGTRSAYYPWLKLMPGSQSTLMWTEEELSCLKGSPLINLTAIKQDRMRREYDSLFGKLRKRFGMSVFPEDGFSFLEYLWCAKLHACLLV